MTDRQRRCVKFIERVLPAGFDGGEDGHAAYEFIGANLAAARRESARQEREAGRFMLSAIMQAPATVCDSSMSFRDIPARVEVHADMSGFRDKGNPLWGLTAGLMPAMKKKDEPAA